MNYDRGNAFEDIVWKSRSFHVGLNVIKINIIFEYWSRTGKAVQLMIRVFIASKVISTMCQLHRILFKDRKDSPNEHYV